MRSWIAKKLGITTELIQWAKSTEARAEAKAEELPYCVENRLVLILLPLEKYFAWQDQWHADSKSAIKYDNQKQRYWDNSRAFLIPYMEKDSEIEKFITKYRRYFLASFVGMHSPKSLWPWEPSVDEFHEWFEYRIVGWGPWDMAQDQLSKSPDMLTAIAHEL
jgi:hypothetical protein